jgi:O-antigen ligase
MTSRWVSMTRNAATAGLLLLVAVTPLVISRAGEDAFRLPKLLFFQAMTLAVAALTSIVAMHDADLRERLLRHRMPLIVVAAGVAWGAIATLLSRKPIVSHDAPFTLFCYALFFALVLALPPLRPRIVLTAVGIPAVITALYSIAQFLRMPTPLIEHDPGGTRIQVIALLGNPNYVATFLVLPCIALIVALFVWPRRALWVAIALVPLLAAVAATLTVTAMAALAAAVAALLLTAPTRKERIGIAILFVVGAIGTAAFPPARHRAATMVGHLSDGRYDVVSSYRIPAFTAATLMFRERPLVGVGPGVFAADYMTYRLRVDELHPEWMRIDNPNFGEVHNDHLQLLTEAGVPAYALFLAFCVLIARMSFRPSPADADEGKRFVRAFAFPAVVGFCVLALAQFPMQLAASASTALFLAAVCFAWERSES